MGQFLGSSDEHPSLVANVRNFKAGYASLQFNVFLDNLFQSVFSSSENDMVVVAIGNQWRPQC